MKSGIYVLLLMFALTGAGCETAEKVTTEGGKAVGKTTNVIGGVTKGGAEAVKGKENNPYGR